MAIELPTIDVNSVGGVKSLQDLYNMLAGETTTTAGGTKTETTNESISQDGMNEMLKSALANTQGLAAISSGQRIAGGYGSSVNTMLTNDLLTRTASQIAQNNKTTTRTTTQAPSTVTKGGVTADGATTAAKTIAGLQGFNLGLKGLQELDNLTGASKKIKDLYTSATTPDPGISGIQISGNNATGNPNFYSSSPAAIYVGDSVSAAPSTNASSDPFSGIDYTADFDMSGFTPSPDFTTVDMSPVDTGGVDLSGITDSMANEYNLLFEQTGFADGGEVSTKQNKPNVLGTSQFNRVVDPRAGKIGGGTGANAAIQEVAPTPVGSNTQSSKGSSNTTQAQVASSGGGGGSSPNATDTSLGKFVNALATEDGQKFAKVLGTLGKLTQSPALQQAGIIGNIVTSEKPAETAALTAANIVTKGAVGQGLSLYKAAKNPGIATAVDAVSTLNPITASVNSILSIFGIPSLGTMTGAAVSGDLSNNIDLRSADRNHMSPAQQQAARDWAAQQGQQVGENALPEPEQVDTPIDVGAIIAGEVPTVSTEGGSGQYSNTGPDPTNDTSAADPSGFGTMGGGGNEGDGFSYGGDVEGPGTGTSDSIQTTLSDGETVVTAKTTAKVKEMFGDDFFHKLEQQFNAPAAVKQKLMGRA